MKRFCTLIAWCAIALVCGIGGTASAAERVALLIGNSGYLNADELPNPKNDANALGAALEQLGFDVELQVDLDQRSMQQALRDFGLKAEVAEVAVVFYAGHGIQVASENYLLPVDARLERERDLVYEGLPLGVVLAEVAQAERLGLVILDACRDNPLADRLRRALGPIRSRVVGQGLARVENLPGDTMIAFSTKPGEVAVDGEGDLSPFTEALIEHIHEPGVELDLLFRKVRDTVLTKTAYRQEPRSFDALGAEPFYFKEPKPNERPQLAQLAALEVLDDAGPSPLAIAPPSDPDNDPLDTARSTDSLDELLGRLGWRLKEEWGTARYVQEFNDSIDKLRSPLGLKSTPRSERNKQASASCTPIDQNLTGVGRVGTTSPWARSAAEYFVTEPWHLRTSLLHGAVYGVPIDGSGSETDRKPSADEVRLALVGHPARLVGEPEQLVAHLGGLLSTFRLAGGQHPNGCWRSDQGGSS